MRTDRQEILVTTPGQAIHRFCIKCVDSAKEVQNCGGDKCKNGGRNKNGICWFFRYRQGVR
jgi:hypothetical protein